MKIKYENPVVEIVEFLTIGQLAHYEKEQKDNMNGGGDQGGGFTSATEGVEEDW